MPGCWTATATWRLIEPNLPGRRARSPTGTARSAGDSLQDQVSLALTRVMQRPPTKEEIQQGLDLIAELQKEDGMSPDQARKYFCLVALNLNEFIYLD